MEDSFRVRVDKVFGSLASPSPNNTTPSYLPSLWTLSDEELERKEWKSQSSSPEHDDHPFPSNLDGFFAPNHTPPPPPATTLSMPSDLQELNDYDDDPNVSQEQDWDIRSSIGLDPTLDFEEEEDEFDKVAIGREEAGDHLYMRDVIDYGIGVNAHNELPSSFAEAGRDPRANHMAAKLRLKEDAEAAGNIDILKLPEIYNSSVTNAQSNAKEDAIIPKPILKKREKPMGEKSPKRVRFHELSLGAKGSAMDSSSVEETSVIGGASDLPDNISSVLEPKEADEKSSLLLKSSSIEDSDVPSVSEVSTGVPDYLRNPTRYTRYSLDSSSDMDEESNRKAYTEFLIQLKKPNSVELHPDDTPVSFQHPLTFTSIKKNEYKQHQGSISKDKPFPVCIAAGDVHTQDSDEVCAMEEDGIETAVGKSSWKPGRQYRTRSRTEADSDNRES